MVRAMARRGCHFQRVRSCVQGHAPMHTVAAFVRVHTHASAHVHTHVHAHGNTHAHVHLHAQAYALCLSAAARSIASSPQTKAKLTAGALTGMGSLAYPTATK